MVIQYDIRKVGVCMGLRFYRRIRICKGIHLNVSKSGVGISLGMRGAAISTGPRGQYVHLGIPGTGIAYRQKLPTNSTVSSDTSESKFLNDSDVNRREYITGSKLEIQIDNNGKELAYMVAPDGSTFVDEEMMRRVKRSDTYRQMLEIARKTKYEYIINKNDSCINIFKKSPKIISIDDVIKERDDTSSIQQKYYAVQIFSEPEPWSSSFYDKAHEWAIQNVKAHFWNKNKLIREATQTKWTELYEEAKKGWEKRRDAFIENEKKTKEIKDKEYEEEYKQKLLERAKTYELVLNPTEEYLTDTVKDVLSQIELPVEFSIDYAISGRKIELDIDLPEIEDYPQKNCSILSSGKLSIKQKSIAELNKDYATGVTGMAFFFASLLFNISPAIEEIAISGYTQRTNPKTGNIEDQYVYSVIFPRLKFAELNIEKIDPIQAITAFEHTMDITSKFELKTINVRDSENRKTDSTTQEEQNEYYSVDPALIEKENNDVAKAQEQQANTTNKESTMSINSTTVENHSNPSFQTMNSQKEHSSFFVILLLALLIIGGAVAGIYGFNYYSYFRTKNDVFVNSEYTGQAFFISKTEAHDENDYPIVNMSWYDAINYCNELSKKNNLACVYSISDDGKVTADFSMPGYRLPTKEEWYWAALGADQNNDISFSGALSSYTITSHYAYFIENSGETVHKVSEKLGNKLGIYDMSGNVAEWCWDSTEDNKRTVMGGFYGTSKEYLNLTKTQITHKPDSGEIYIGFRTVRSFVKKDIGVSK